MHAGRGGGAALDEIHQRWLIDHRIGVGHYDHSGDAARRRGVARGLQCLAIFAARLAGEDAHIDEAGGQYQPVAVDDFCVVGLGIVEQTRPDVSGAAMLHQQSAAHIQLRLWIDQARIAEG